MTLKRRRTFWITSNKTLLHEQRAQALAGAGFEVIFVIDSSDAAKLSHQSRPICVLIDSPPQGNSTSLISLLSLVKDPELNGVRFIASITDDAPDLIRLATSENFRDVLPMAIPNDQWINRFLYANAIKAADELNLLPEIGMNQVASTISSGRIVWISQTQIRIECRGSQRPGNALHISGAISKAFNVPHISLAVLRTEKKQLMYRYSQALICEWRVPATHANHASSILQQVLNNKPSSRIRAFIAIGRPSVRTTLAKGLNPDRFFVRAGLQKANLRSEITYFSPGIIFFDDKVLENMSEMDVRQTLTEVPISVPIVVFGNDSEKLRELFGERRIFIEESIQQEYLKNAETRYDVHANVEFEDSDLDFCHIQPEHPWSKIGVHTPARLAALSPLGGQLLLPFSIGNYTLASVEAPFLTSILGRSPVIKITAATASEVSPMFGHSTTFHFADVNAKEQSALAHALVELVKDYYSVRSDAAVLAKDSVIGDQNSQSQQGQNPLELILDNQKSKSEIVSGGGYDGSSALKEETRDARNASSPNRLNKSTTGTRPIVGKAVLRSASTSRSKSGFDPVVLKAFAAFFILAILMALILKFAEQMGSKRDNDLGKEYSEFFFRMNPELRKKSDRNDPNSN